jgi:hypothetical protein
MAQGGYSHQELHCDIILQADGFIFSLLSNPSFFLSTSQSKLVE